MESTFGGLIASLKIISYDKVNTAVILLCVGKSKYIEVITKVYDSKKGYIAYKGRGKQTDPIQKTFQASVSRFY